MTSAFIPKHSYTRDELLSCGHGKMFGPGNARLPTGLMLMVDRIIDINATGGSEGKGRVLAELDIHPDLWFDAQTRGVQANFFPAEAFARLGGTMILMPKQSVSQVVRRVGGSWPIAVDGSGWAIALGDRPVTVRRG